MSSTRPSLPASHSGSSLSVHSVADTVASTTALTAAYRPPQKDYAAAFAALQVQYGTSGDFAAPPTKEKKRQSKRASRADLLGASSTVTPTPSSSHPPDRRSSSAHSPIPERAPEESTPRMAGETEQEKGKVSKLKKLFSVRLKDIK